MYNDKNHDKTIMTNEDPDETIDTLCKILDSSITRSTYKKTFEDLFRKGISISSQHNDAHFYLLTQLGLLIKLIKQNFNLDLLLDIYAN